LLVAFTTPGTIVAIDWLEHADVAAAMPAAQSMAR